MPVRPWKRPTLFAVSALIGSGFFALGWLAEDNQDMGEVAAVVIGMLIGLIGAVVAVFGCDKCVARLFGDF